MSGSSIINVRLRVIEDSEAKRFHSKNDYKRLRFLKSKLTKDSIYWDTLDSEHKLNGLDVIDTLVPHCI